MDTITFKKNGVSKNTLTDFGMYSIGEINPESGSGEAEFVMRFGDIPIETRITELEKMFNEDGELASIFSSDPKYEYHGKWSLKRKPKIGVGMGIGLAYDLDDGKFEKDPVNSKWAWDEFNFDEDTDLSKVFSNLEATNDKEFMPIEGIKDFIGDVAVVPEFYNKSDKNMIFRVNGKTGKVGPGEKKKFDYISFDPDEDLEAEVKGMGSYEISFVRGVK